MLETSAAVAFLPSGDLERSERFFRGVLNLALVSRSPFAAVFTVGGGTLRVTRVEALRPQPFTVFGWLVTDLRAPIATRPVAVADVRATFKSLFDF